MQQFENGKTYFGLASDPFSERNWSSTVFKETDGTIVLTVQTKPGDGNWADWASVWHHDSLQTNALPQFLGFDGDGISLALYGCSTLGVVSRTSQVTATVRPEFAVEGISYFPLNGAAGTVRGEITGLFNWLGAHSLESILQHGKEGGISERQTRTVNNTPIRFCEEQDKRLELLNAWSSRDSARPNHRGPWIHYSSIGYMQREVFPSGLWREGFDSLESIRALLSISAWQPHRIVSTQMTFETCQSPAEEIPPRLWHNVHGLGMSSVEPSSKAPIDYLYDFDDIGIAGLELWQSLWKGKHSRRIIQKLLLILESDLNADQKLIFVGESIESFAHHLVQSQGRSPKRRSFEKYADMLIRYVEPVTAPQEVADWCAKAAGNYNLLKHSDKEDYEPGPFELLEIVAEGVFYLRVAIALLLGADRQDIKEKVVYDHGNPDRHSYSVSKDPADRFRELQWHFANEGNSESSGD